MLVGWVQRRIQTKVYSYTATHESLAIEILANVNCGFDVKEGGYDAAEGLQRRPGVNRRILIYCLADLDEV